MSCYTSASPTFSRPHVSYIVDEDLVIYDDLHPEPEPEKDWSKEYLTFLALEDGTFKFTRNPINYSLDGGQTWTELAANTTTPTVTAGNKIMFKGNASITNAGIGTFSSSGNYEAMGNPYSLIYGDAFYGDITSTARELYGLFRDSGKREDKVMEKEGAPGLVSAEHLGLPNIPLTMYCYSNMLMGCELLTTAPALPAVTLAGSCYHSMFYGCSSLTTAPALPSTTLADNCYNSMFASCTSLTTAPELPAATLAERCYYGMFFGCPSLNYIKMLATDVTATDCLVNWLDGVSATGTFIKHPDANLESGVNGIPAGWTVQTATE